MNLTDGAFTFQALKLRSLDHIYVLVYVEPKFSFTKNKVSSAVSA